MLPPLVNRVVTFTILTKILVTFYEARLEVWLKAYHNFELKTIKLTCDYTEIMGKVVHIVLPGTCAQGFGACCFIALEGCGGSVPYNCTYIRYLTLASHWSRQLTRILPSDWSIFAETLAIPLGTPQAAPAPGHFQRPAPMFV